MVFGSSTFNPTFPIRSVWMGRVYRRRSSTRRSHHVSVPPATVTLSVSQPRTRWLLALRHKNSGTTLAGRYGMARIRFQPASSRHSLGERPGSEQHQHVYRERHADGVHVSDGIFA